MEENEHGDEDMRAEQHSIGKLSDWCPPEASPTTPITHTCRPTSSAQIFQILFSDLQIRINTNTRIPKHKYVSRKIENINTNVNLQILIVLRSRKSIISFKVLQISINS